MNNLFDQENLSQYSIIYPASHPGTDASAQLLMQTVKESCGYELPVLSDKDAVASPFEILIGKTDRPLSERCYSADGARRLMTYELIAEDQTLQIACGGPHSARYAIKEIADILSGSAELSLGVRHDLAPEHIPHTDGTDVRVMSANILGECYRTKKHTQPISSERAEIFAKMMLDYTPDIIGVQEMDVNYHVPLRYYFEILRQSYGMEYQLILEVFGDKNNDSPIIYRSDKYRLDSFDFETIPYQALPPKSCENKYPCGLSSAKFTSLEDGTTELALLSAHWHWQKEADVQGVPNQEIDAMIMAKTFNALEEKYPGIHAFCTGDLNTHRFEKKYLYYLLDSIGGAVASTIAQEAGVLTPSFMHMGQYIDHIIGKAGTFDVLLHRGAQNCAKALTDHQPIFADIKFITKT